MEQKYEDRFTSVREEIAATKFAAFTTDLWDTKNHKKTFLRFYLRFELVHINRTLPIFSLTMHY